MHWGSATWGALFLVAVVTGGCDEEKKSPAPDESSGGASNGGGGEGGGGNAPPRGWRAAVGDDGTLLQSFDDTVWTARTVAPADLYAVTCVGNLDGWAAGDRGTLVSTHDSGETWTTHPTPFDGALRAIHVSAHPTARFVGVAAGDDGALAVSLGGREWTRADVTTTDLNAVANVPPLATGDSHVMLVVGDAGALFRSVDLGTSWTEDRLAGAADLTALGVDPHSSLAFAVDSAGGIWRSNDRGQAFELEAQAEQPLRGLALEHGTGLAFAVGDAGTLLVRELDGSWRGRPTPTASNLLAALISHDGYHFYAAGVGGTLLHAELEPTDFTVVQSPVSITLNALEDLDPE